MRVMGFWFLLLCCGSAVGQVQVGKGAAAPDRFAAEPFVLEKRDTVYRMVADGTGTARYTVVARVQSEAALKELGVVSVAFAANSQHVEIAYARVRRPDGSVAETPVKDAIEMPTQVTQQAPFYSDQKVMQLPIRSLRVGDTLEWQATVVVTKAEAVGEFWGQESFVPEGVVLSQTLELRVPTTKTVTVWSPKYKAVESTDGGEKVYRWSYEHLDPTVGAAADAAKEAKKKKVWTAEQETDARDGKLPDVAWTTFRSWEAVGAWYRGLEANRMVPDEAVKAKVAELTAGKTSDLTKAQAVYAYVSGSIRYIGVAFGVGRYQPHGAGVVLENQYGDCKDKHTLLSAMLGALGLHPEAALIGAGVRFNEAVPSPEAFNHLITRVAVEGKTVWLDSTAEVAPWGMLVQPIRGKMALVVPENGPAVLAKTPEDAPFAQTQTMTATGALDKEGVSNSRITMSFRGDTELLLRAVLRQVGAGQYDAVAQQMSQGMGYGGTTSHAEIQNLEDTSKPLTVSYDYKRDKGGDWPNRRIVAQLAPVVLPRPDMKEPPVQELNLGVRRTETSESEMKLPEGWGADLPAPVHLKSSYATLDVTYRFGKGTLYATRRLEVLKERVPVAEWKSWSTFAEAGDLGNDAFVQLTHTGAERASDTEMSSPAADGSGKAAQLLQEAARAAEVSDFAQADEKLKEAEALNAHEPRLWAVKGFVSMRRGEISAATKDYEREIAEHPEEAGWVYPTLVQTLVMHNDQAGAKAALTKWVTAEPKSAQPVRGLMAMEETDGDAEQALATGQAALARIPDAKMNDDLQRAVGEAEIKTRRKTEGAARLTAVLDRSQDALVLNNTSYVLAEAGVELGHAEAGARKAAELLSAESLGWTIDGSLNDQRARTALAEATWDTLGWILYREGKLMEAEDYVKAAWRARQETTVGVHLGAIAAARGEKNEELTIYEEAQKTIAEFDSMGVHNPPTVTAKRLMRLTDELRKEGAKPATSDAASRLQAERIFSLGEAHGLNGTAEYRLLMAHGGVTDAAPTGEKKLVGGVERLKAAQGLAGLWPPGSAQVLARLAILNCHSGVCEMVLEP